MPPLPRAERISIRQATQSDLGTILEFRLAMMVELFEDKDGARFEMAALREPNERWIGDHFGRDFFAWIADLDGHPAASAALMWYPHPPGPKNPLGLEAYILNVYTVPGARRMGLAKALIQQLVEEARGRGVRRIWLRASEVGRPLYEGLGFRTSNYLQLTQD
jgi:GNAT superfamily N-acetyltransferase